MKPFVLYQSRPVWLFLATCIILCWANRSTSFGDEPTKSDPATPVKTGRPESKTILIPNSTKTSFDFETTEMRGTIRLDGAYHGVSRLVDKHTGRQVIDSRYSALNLFRLMSVNQAMDEPRMMTRTIESSPTWVEATWAARESHKAKLTARYEVVAPNAVDLTVTVRSVGIYPRYELFMSNYFDKALRPYVYLRPRGKGGPERVLPSFNDVFRETVLVFPRDGHVARRCVDGRWDHGGAVSPVVQMCPVRYYGYCLAWLADADKKLGTVLMSHPRHSYAISTRYFAEDPAEKFTTYSAFDFSMFGNDLVPGDVRVAKVRLALTPLDSEMSQPLKMYRAFIAEMDDQFNHSQSKEATP